MHSVAVLFSSLILLLEKEKEISSDLKPSV